MESVEEGMEVEDDGRSGSGLSVHVSLLGCHLPGPVLLQIVVVPQGEEAVLEHADVHGLGVVGVHPGQRQGAP